MSDDSWSMAADLVAGFLKSPARISHLVERIPAHWEVKKRRACQSLLIGTIRHLRLLEKALDEFLRKRPKPGLRSCLLVSSRELMEQPERTAKIVHNAVSKIGERYSKAEKGLANAVLRKVAKRLPELISFRPTNAADLAWRYSHPQWMVSRWIEQFGLAATVELLHWNQSEAGVFARWQRDPANVPELLPLEKEPGFFALESGAWEKISLYIEEGRLYVQNPAAGIAPRLLAQNVRKGRLLDLCAAPGGKSLALEALADEEVSQITSVDLRGPRYKRMVENFERYGAKRARPLEADLLEMDPAELGLFEGVLLDAPCSNSGVLQHKVDARWRQSREGLAELVALQDRLLRAACGFVAPGGYLVYSTCSVDEEENAGLVSTFLANEKGRLFELVESKVSLPWLDARDGAGVFLLRKRLT